jgi:hypothetical protein
MNKKGRKYEHAISRDVAAATSGDLMPLGGGFNGQTAWDVDMLIDDGEAVHVFELKRTKQDAYTLHWDEDNRDKDDLYGLCKFCYNYPRPAYPYAAVRFNQKQLVATKLFIEKWPDKDELLESAVMTDPTDAVSVTHANNLRFRKEGLGTDWPASDLEQHDAQHVLDTIGYMP